MKFFVILPNPAQVRGLLVIQVVPVTGIKDSVSKDGAGADTVAISGRSLAVAVNNNKRAGEDTN